MKRPSTYLGAALAMASLASGCASVAPVKADLDENRFTVTCPAAALTSQAVAETLDKHVIQVDKQGRYEPVRYTARCGGPSLEGEQPPRLGQLVDSIREKLSRSAGRYQQLLIYIHGGLVERPAGMESAVTLAHAILNDENSKTYPLIVTWRSGGTESYGDQLLNVRNGEEDSSLAVATFPMKLGADLGSGLADSPFAAGLEGSRLVQSLTNQLNECVESDHAPEVICPNPADYSFIHTGETSAYFLFTPVRIGTAPLINGLGRPAWENMIRHTRSAFWRERAPEDGSPASPEDFHGAVYQLFKQLAREQATLPKLTLIGHSMGTILATEAIRQFPDLPYENIVFMAPAVSIREFNDGVAPVLAKPDQTAQFYNLSLLPVSEAREMVGFGLLPSGSLLEWVDEMYTSPATLADRTLGKWTNVRRVLRAFPDPASAKMHFRIFGTQAGQPQKHGEFNDLYTCFWRKEFWTTRDAKWPDYRQQCAALVRKALGEETSSGL